jgi:signal transduction histidine kinase
VNGKSDLIRLNTIVDVLTESAHITDYPSFFKLMSTKLKWVIDYDSCYFALCSSISESIEEYEKTIIHFQKNSYKQIKCEQIPQNIKDKMNESLKSGLSNDGDAWKYRLISFALKTKAQKTLGVICFESESSEFDLQDIKLTHFLGEFCVGSIERIESQITIMNHSSELKLLVSQLQQERELREKFVATISHDLRSPITIAKLSADLILRTLDNPCSTERYSSKILESLRRADLMIQDILNTSLIRAGEKLPLRLSDFNLCEVIISTINNLSTVHGERFITFVPSEINGRWDSNAIQRVIENLVSNAIKYGDPQTPIWISAKLIDEIVQITIRNEGAPLTADEQKLIFEPYKRTNSAKYGGKKGWGLGLTLVRDLIQSHNGKIKVESGDKIGTTFTIELPRIAAEVTSSE